MLGLRIENTEGAKFWLKVMNELRNRGVGDILIAVVDGLKGFPEAIEAVFPRAIVQTCIVHLIRHSLEFVSWADRKLVVPQLRALYRAKDADAGRAALEAFAAGPWGRKCHRAGVAEKLGQGHPLLRLSGGRAAHRIHNECDRGVERQAEARRQNPGAFSN